MEFLSTERSKGRVRLNSYLKLLESEGGTNMVIQAPLDDFTFSHVRQNSDVAVQLCERVAEFYEYLARGGCSSVTPSMVPNGVAQLYINL